MEFVDIWTCIVRQYSPDIDAVYVGRLTLICKLMQVVLQRYLQYYNIMCNELLIDSPTVLSLDILSRLFHGQMVITHRGSKTSYVYRYGMLIQQINQEPALTTIIQMVPRKSGVLVELHFLRSVTTCEYTHIKYMQPSGPEIDCRFWLKENRIISGELTLVEDALHIKTYKFNIHAQKIERLREKRKQRTQFRQLAPSLKIPQIIDDILSLVQFEFRTHAY